MQPRHEGRYMAPIALASLAPAPAFFDCTQKKSVSYQMVGTIDKKQHKYIAYVRMHCVYTCIAPEFIEVISEDVN